MSTNYSPKIVTDGLTLYYDSVNTQKSFKGAPTTNMYADGDFSSGVLHPVRSGTWAFVPDPRDSNKKVLKATPSGGTQYHGRDIPAVVSSVYSLQMEIFVSPDFDGTNVQMIPEQGGSGAARAYDLSKRGTWQRLSFNGKSATTTNIRLLAYILSASTTGFVLISNVQCELYPFATPFTVSPRSSSDVVVNIIGGNPITANSLTYASDNTFSFNGSSDYLTLATSLDCFNKSYSIEAWIRRSVIGVAHGITGDTQFGWFNFYINSNNKLFLQHGYYNPGELRSNVTGSSNILANVWHHVVCTFDQYVGMKLYVNGQLDGSNANTFAFALSGTDRGPRYYGRSDTSSFGAAPNYFNGNIDNIKGYSNRALSEAEVIQNFNATRGRYGI